MSRTRYLWCGILLLAILIVSFVPVRSTLACEPESDYWFTEIFELTEIDLPENITLWADSGGNPEGVIYIANDLETPLYILPAGSQALVDASDEIAALAVYILEINENKGKNIWIAELIELDPNIEDRNVLEVTRPDEVEIPAAQETAILLVFDGELFEIPLTISYDINHGYAPRDCNVYWDNLEAEMLAAEAATAEALAEQESSSESVEADTAETQNNGSSLYVVAGAGAILVLGVGGWLIWRQRQG